MANSSLLKGGVVVVLLLAALAVFDSYSTYSTNQITAAAVSEGQATDPPAIAVTIQRGWNLVAVNALEGRTGISCAELRNLVHAFYPQVKKDGAYGSYMLNSNLNGIAPKKDDDVNAELMSSYPEVLSAARAVWLYNKGVECAITSQIKPHTEPFPLAAGWNMVAVQPHWVGKKASEVMGSCSSGKSWAGMTLSSDPTQGWDIINPDTVFGQDNGNKAGKGFFALVQSDCTAQAEGVDLVPELVVKPMENLKSGGSIEVTLRVKNIGTKSTSDQSVFGKCTGRASQSCGWSFNNIIYFYKEKEYGTQVIPELSSSTNLIDNEIKPDGSKRLVSKGSVKIPEDFSGNLVIAAVVDPGQTYIEAEGGKDNNKKLITLAVTAATGAPNLVATGAEAAPRIKSLPAEVLSMLVTVKNVGEKAAVAEQRFLINKVSIYKGDAEICRDMRSDTATIMPGESKTFGLTPKSTTGADSCKLGETADYKAIVEVDASDVVAESDEDNKFEFAIKEEPTCSPLGAREDGRYCEISSAKWLPQKSSEVSDQACSHNFECLTDMCIDGKCVTEARKERILNVVG